MKSSEESLRINLNRSVHRADLTRRLRTAGRLLAFVLQACLPVLLASGDPPALPPSLQPCPVVGMTEPFRVATLASVQSARIAAVRFEEGAYAAEGEVVVALQDGVQRARTELARAAVDTSLPIDLERAKLTRARRDLERLKRLQGDDFASSKELSDALAVAEIAQVEYDLSVFNQEQARRAYEREKETLAEYQIRAPFPAYVANHLKHAGESVDQLEGIVRLVQLDPLLVPVDCPLTLATSVAVGDRYVVRPVDPHWQPRIGTVVFASQVADAASQTFKVKLTVDNADRRWIAGLKVVVDFSIDEVMPEADSSSTARDERRTQAASVP